MEKANQINNSDGETSISGQMTGLWKGIFLLLTASLVVERVRALLDLSEANPTEMVSTSISSLNEI